MSKKTTDGLNPLARDIAGLMAAGGQQSKTLERGLTIAYNPDDPAGFRLTVSRLGVYPSMTEVNIVKRELTAVLTAAGRLPEKFEVEPWLQTKQGRGKARFYHVIHWRELTQGSLL